MSYVTGYVLQELLALSASQPAAQQPAKRADRFPLVFKADPALAALSSDDLFDASVELLLSGQSAPI